MATKVKAITYEESLTMPEVKYEEIVNGEVRVMAFPSLKHQELLSYLVFTFERQLDRRTVVALQTYGQAIREKPTFTYRGPDLGLFLKKNMVTKDPYYVWSPPELLIEVLSPSQRRPDLDELLHDYESIQTPEVWLVHEDLRAVRRLVLVDGKLRETERVSRGTISPTRFPNVGVDLSEVWRILDED